MHEVLENLRSQIGQETGVSSWWEIDQERIDAFAEATGDHQFIHVNPELAAQTPFGGTIAHGFLTLSMLPMLTRAGAAQPAYPGVKLSVNYGLNRVRFPAPVKAGARLRARSTLQGVTEVRGGLQLIRLVTIDVEGSEKPACVAESVSRLYFE